MILTGKTVLSELDEAAIDLEELLCPIEQLILMRCISDGETLIQIMFRTGGLLGKKKVIIVRNLNLKNGILSLFQKTRDLYPNNEQK
ncbi:hypothetical protein TSUD_03560 [Trifolium subterraneum]|nr:hypothetical protein TSUD_03560 [Trifolium subterraneum]